MLIKSFYKTFICFLILTLAQLATEGQSKFGLNKINLYVFASRYDDNMKNILLADGFKFAKLLTEGSIMGKDENIDVAKITRSIEKTYSSSNDSGVCVIDWEKMHYKNLKKFDKEDDDFRLSEQQFLNCIQAIRNVRPNLKIGIYGLPFAKYKIGTVDDELDNVQKFIRILSSCDFIAPSLYMPYPAEQAGEPKNQAYLDKNLEVALKLGQQLNKPVIPFFWHRIHPSNKQYGNTVIPEAEFSDYLNTLLTKSVKGQKIAGLFWWEYSIRSQLKNLPLQNNIDNNTLLTTYKNIILSYLK